MIASKMSRNLPRVLLGYSSSRTVCAGMGKIRSMATASDSDPNVVHSKLAPQVIIPPGTTMTELIREQTSQLPSGLVAYQCAVTGMKLTRDEVISYGRSFGAALLQSGLKKGDTVAIILPNCPQYMSIVMGLLDTGIIGSQISPALMPGELASLVKQSNAKAIVTISQFAPVAKQMKAQAGGSIQSIIVVGEAVEGCHTFTEMIKTDPVGAEFIDGSKINTNEETAMILWSSGTTGPPKGAMITHDNITSSLVALHHKSVCDFVPGGERLFGLVPFFHIYGSVAMLYYAMYGGGLVTTMPMFDPALFTKTLKMCKPTYLHLVPPLVNFVTANPAITKADLSETHTVICGAAATGQVLINNFLDKIGSHIFFQEGYGMTETTGQSHIVLKPYHNSRTGSIGHPTPHTSSKIVDIDTGKALGPNQNGEIFVKGPQIMKGYLNNEEATKQTIDDDGWIHTGDIGYYTEKEELFYVVDRLKELIKVKGLQVAPSELEDILREHKSIADVAIIGIPDDRAGEVPRAYVVKRDETLSESAVQGYLEGRVAEYKQLQGGVEFVDAIPKSPSGKILRREMIASYKQKTAAAN